MKKIILIAAMMLCSTAMWAQGHMVINSEKVFKSIAKYNEAIAQLEKLQADYQKNIDTAYEGIEKMYNEYQLQKGYLSEATRAAREDAIINREKEVEKYQQEVFGPEGTLFKKREELLKPIQEKVSLIIQQYAERNGYTLVLDVATNASAIYYSPKVDKTEDIIKLVK